MSGGGVGGQLVAPSSVSFQHVAHIEVLLAGLYFPGRQYEHSCMVDDRVIISLPA
jgi:hypothetical protein